MRTTNFMMVPIRISSNNRDFVNDWIWAAENFTSAQAAQYEMFSSKFHGGNSSGYETACAAKGTFSGDRKAPPPGGQKLTRIVNRTWTVPHGRTTALPIRRRACTMRIAPLKS